MRDISKVRFDALAAYARAPEVALVAKELRWLEFAEERVLATLIVDSDHRHDYLLRVSTD